MNSYKKVFSVLILAVLTFVLISCAIFSFYLVQFNSHDFILSRYQNQRVLEKRIFEAFPVGTDREYLEKLVFRNGVRKFREDISGREVVYISRPAFINYPPNFAWTLDVTYNDFNKVSDVKLGRIDSPFAFPAWERAEEK